MTVQVEMTPEQEATVNEVAALEGLSVAEVLAQTASFVFAEQRRERELIRERVAKANRGEFLNEDEANSRLARILRRS
jgi:predicted transcriptional regulator